MDSRDPNNPPPPPNHHHHQHQHHHHQHQNHPYNNHHNSPNSMHNNRFPFNSMQPNSPKPLDSLNYGFESASSAAAAAKKKRGRPRKYAPDGNIALGLAPTTSPTAPSSISPPRPSPNTSSAIALLSTPVGGGNSENAPSSEAPAKRNRGRPPGSGKKQLDALGASGIGFTPHVIMVNSGEDIVSKIMAFSQQGPRTVCILSANGSISSVVLRQPSISGGNITYEGRFEIISLSGSFSLSEISGPHSRTGGLSVSLAGSDGRVLGGGVSGQLVAASPVQVIVGSFIADGKKQTSNLLRSLPSSAPPAPTQSNMLTFGPQTGTPSPPSQPGSSESSDGNESTQFNRAPGPYGNVPQPLHTMPAYTPMGWPNSAMKNAS